MTTGLGLLTGTVKNIVAARGFGFLTRDDGEGDVFFHASHLQNFDFDAMRSGQRVVFDLDRLNDLKGPRAATVTVLDVAELEEA